MFFLLLVLEAMRQHRGREVLAYRRFGFSAYSCPLSMKIGYNRDPYISVLIHCNPTFPNAGLLVQKETRIMVLDHNTSPCLSEIVCLFKLVLIIILVC